MTQDEIIRMAKEAGLLADDEAWVSPHQEAMERFAALVAAHEREACAKVCDERELANLYGVKECAAAIRARSEK
jgi:hypothetical protein